MTIAVLDYNVESVDIITTDRNFQSVEDVENFLGIECHYNLDEIHFMFGENISTRHLSETCFINKED